MLSTKELISQVASLPIEERVLIIDTLLKTIHMHSEETDRKWIALAKQRLNELRSGEVTGIPGDEVFAKIQQRFAK
jgi:putative addiction module component (TIGR02574 family)